MKKNYERNWRFSLKSLALSGLMAIAGSSSAQLNGIYTVNAGSSSTSTNFQSMLEVADSLETLGVSGPVTITMVAGSGPYIGNVDIDFDNVTGVSAINRVTINGNGEEIVGTNRALNVVDGKHLDLINCKFRTTNTGVTQVVRFGATAEDIFIDDCEFVSFSTNVNVNTTAYLEMTGGSGFFAGSDDILDVTIQNCKMWNAGEAGRGVYVGIVINQPLSHTDDHNILISNNEILDFAQFGVKMEYTSGVIIENNVLHSDQTIVRTGDAYGMDIIVGDFAGFDPDEPTIIRGNKIYNFGGSTTSTFLDKYGMDVESVENSASIEIYNNSIDVNNVGGRWGIRCDGDGFPDFNGTWDIHHNSVIVRGANVGTFESTSAMYLDNGTGTGTYTIQNNIFVTDVANTAVTFDSEFTGHWTVNVQDPISTVILSDNVILNESTGVRAFTFNDDGTYHTTYESWETAGGAINSFNIDPNFVDLATGDLTPNALGFSNAALPVAGITTDITGATRSATPDIGAYEFSVDVEILSVNMTTMNQCAPYSEAVEVTVQNNGTLTINNIPLQYTINGGTAVEEVLTASIASGATATFTFTEAPTFFGTNAYMVEVSTLGDDDVPANSTANTTINTIASPTGGNLAEGAMFDGYFNAGTMGDPDATVNTYVSEYEILPATQGAPSLAGYSYSMTATTAGGIDVTGSGFTLASSTDNKITMDPMVSLAGESIFVEITALDANTGCDTAFGRWLYVPHTPVASFDAADICLGEVAQFKNTSTLGGTSFITTTWEFNDPDASVTDDNSDIKDGFWEYSTFGNNVMVEMTVANGLYPKFEYTTTNTINVTPKPEIDFKVLNACEGSPITIVNSTTLPTTDPITYSWDFAGAAMSTAVNPSYTFATPGQRQITVVASANGCDAMLTKNAYQFEKPVADFSSTGECNFEDVAFNNASMIPNEGRMGYAWDFNGEGISREESPLYAFATAGAKTVTLTSTSEFGCTDMISKVVNLNVSPEADFTIDQACNLTPINFTRTGTANAAQSTWAWDFNGESASGQENPTYLFNRVGTKMVTLTIADLNGCTNSITKEIDVVLQAVADFNVASVCDGDAAVFTNKSTVAAGDLTYSWSFGDGPTAVSSDLSPTWTYSTPGTYNVTLEAIVAGGCSDQVTIPVTVNPSPVAAFTFVKDGRSVVFNGPAGNDEYRWRFGDGGSSQMEDPTYIYDRQDIATFEACLATKEGECRNETCETISIDLVGVDELTKDNSMISVYPNPSTGQFTVTVENAGDVEVKVGDILGNTMNVTVVDNFNGKYSVDMSAVADGVYFVQVKNGNFYATKRITVSK